MSSESCDILEGNRPALFAAYKPAGASCSQSGGKKEEHHEGNKISGGTLALFVIAAIPSAAAPLVGPCAAGAAYDPACDVDHDGDVDIYDIQLLPAIGTNGYL